MFILGEAVIANDDIKVIRQIDNTVFNDGDVIATYTKGDTERMPWRIVAGGVVGEYALQYRYSKGGSVSPISGAIREGDDVWRYFTGNDDMSHRRYFWGINNAKAACKRHYERNN